MAFKFGTLVQRVLRVTTAAGTTVLTNISERVVEFIGVSTQTAQLPDATTAVNGREYYLANRSTMTVTVTFNDTTTLTTISPNSEKLFILVDAGTSNGVWDVSTGSGGTSTSFSWTGYNDLSVNNWFFTNSGAFADPSSQSSNGNAVITVDNNGFGSVTSPMSGPSVLPGIIFTPPAIARFKFSAVIQIVNTPGAGDFTAVRIWDGTTSFSNVSVTNNAPVTLTGIVNCSSLASKTIKIQAQVNTGTGVISNTGDGQAMISWEISKV
jgi:hypothetical protein